MTTDPPNRNYSNGKKSVGRRENEEVEMNTKERKFIVGTHESPYLL
jgi:hypothetical protein